MRDANTPGTTANRLGRASIDGIGESDNLSIALASYFEGHVGRPDDDPIDDETGYGEWVMEKTLSALEEIGNHIDRK